MQEIIDLIARYGYIILFVYSLGGGFIALVGASVLSYIGKMDLPLTLFVAATANFLGDVILFCLARYQKQSVKPYLVGHRRKIALIHLLMKRHGFIILIVKKYIYGFRTLVPIVAAFVNYPLDRFMLYNILGACIWSISIGVCAYYLGEILVGIFDSFPKYSGYIIPLIVVVLLFVLWKWLGSKSNKNHGMYFKK